MNGGGTVLQFEEIKAQAYAHLRKCGPVLEAFGDRNRREILMLLGDHGRMNVRQITSHLPLSRPAVSHHLKVLLTGGLVHMERDGTENFYSVDIKERLADLKELVRLMELLCPNGSR